jgi:hypothetical protein
MKSVGRVEALLLSMLVCAVTQSIAATMTPYETVLLDARQPNTLLVVNMDTGNFREISVPIEGFGGYLIATDSNGAMYVYDQIDFAFETGATSRVARIDPSLSDWTTTRIDTDIDWPLEDMEFMRDGNLIAGGEFGLMDIDLGATTVRFSRFQPTGEYNADGATIGIEIDSSGTVMFGATTIDSDALLFRQSAEAQLPERFEIGFKLEDFVLDYDGSLIGVWDDGRGFSE